MEKLQKIIEKYKKEIEEKKTFLMNLKEIQKEINEIEPLIEKLGWPFDRNGNYVPKIKEEYGKIIHQLNEKYPQIEFYIAESPSVDTCKTLRIVPKYFYLSCCLKKATWNLAIIFLVENDTKIKRYLEAYINEYEYETDSDKIERHIRTIKTIYNDLLTIPYNLRKLLCEGLDKF